MTTLWKWITASVCCGLVPIVSLLAQPVTQILSAETEREILLELQQDPDQLESFRDTYRKDGVYTLSMMVEEALKANQTVLLQRDELLISEEGVVQSRSSLLPSANFSMSFDRRESRNTGFSVFGESANSDDTSIDNTYTNNLSLSYRFSWGDWIRYGQSRTNQSIERTNLHRTKDDIIFQVLSTYFDLIQRNHALRVFKDAVDRSKEQLRIASDQFSVGKLRQVDVLEARQALEQARQDLLEGFFDRQTTRTDLAILANWHPLSVYQIDMRFPQEEPGFRVNDPEVQQKYIDKLLESQPQLQELQLQIESSDQSIEAARSNFYPTVTLSTGYNWTDEDGFTTEEDKRLWNLNATLTVPLFDGFRDASGLEEASLRKQQAQLRLEQARSQLSQSVIDSLRTVNETANAIEIAKTQVSVATEVYNIENNLFQIGRATSSDLAEKSLELTRAELVLIQSRFAYNQALARLEQTLSLSLDWSKPAGAQTIF